MRSYNRTLHPLQYSEEGMGLWLYAFDAAIDGKAIPYMPNPHLHRRWEYAMAMEFLNSLGGTERCPRILDVGGAGSLFAPIALTMGYDVTVVDPDPCVGMFAGQQRSAGGTGRAICADFMEWGTTHAPYSVETFDVVLSLSTIEHVPNDVEFIQKLACHARRGLFLTTDFSMSGEVFQAGHLRTYSPKTMQNKLVQALPEEWKLAGEPEWVDSGGWIMGYNFASMGAVIDEDI